MKHIDPIIEEVRKARNLHARKFRYKLGDICADLKKIEKQSGHRVVRILPQPTRSKKTTVSSY
jgi:hypothetical protein